MIQFHQVVKKFSEDGFELGELSFHIEEGEFTFLIGPSGSGKTTIIRMLIREENPSQGKIYFDDYDITKLSRNNVYKLRRQIGVIFQDYKLIPDKTAYENVAFAMEAAGRSNSEIKETVPYVLDIVGLSHRDNAFPRELSGGEKQRVAIARAVANNPRVLIADEPTGNLDPASAWDIVQILSKINNWGTTVIMSTHGTDIVNSLNKRVIQMEGGQIVRDDSKGRYEITEPEEIAEKKELVAEQTQKKRGPLKVNIRNRSEDSESQSTGGMFGLSWLGFGKQKHDQPLIDEKGHVGDGEYEGISLDELIPGNAQEVVEKADNTAISELELEPQVIADLEGAGYKDIEDIIEAGPEKLQSELMIDPSEVVEVAKALEKFVEKASATEAKKNLPNLPKVDKKVGGETGKAKSKKSKVKAKPKTNDKKLGEAEFGTKKSDLPKANKSPKKKAKRVNINLVGNNSKE